MTSECRKTPILWRTSSVCCEIGGGRTAGSRLRETPFALSRGLGDIMPLQIKRVTGGQRLDNI